MLATIQGFPTPIRIDDLLPGDLVHWQDVLEPWLLMKVVDGARQQTGFVVLDGPDGRRPPGGWPSFLDTDVISGVLARVPSVGLQVEPLGGPDYLAMPLNDNPCNGSLIIDRSGRAWICVVRMSHLRTYWALDTGELGHPDQPFLGFKNFEICLRIGRERIVLASLGN